ncbi:MAG: type II toxin-antitoxin system RelB/DinJ family antitoxin [Eggerthellaceae bacterium]|nr:type II toxin-antitoxin system RelB/DinJ family antitoxin [Eggerthellaceae bacterium]
MDATLNVRMSAPLKERGDKVLRENGISTSAAVRALWQELAATRTLPSFLEDLTQAASSKKTKRLALDALVGVAQGSLSDLTDEELEAVGVARYE